MFLEKADSHKFYIHKQVELEIEGKQDELLEWFSQNKNKFYSINAKKEKEIMDKSKEIIGRYEGLSKNKTNNADPYIIASASILKGKVITDEQGSNTLPSEREKFKKIPDVCKTENIVYLNVFDFIEEIKIKFN